MDLHAARRGRGFNVAKMTIRNELTKLLRESASEAGMTDPASEWTKAWRIIAESLQEMGASSVDHNARAIIARLAAQNMLIVGIDNVKE